MPLKWYFNLYRVNSTAQLGRPVGHLLMNQADEYRNVQELRELIDRAMPAVDYGKGCKYADTFIRTSKEFNYSSNLSTLNIGCE